LIDAARFVMKIDNVHERVVAGAPDRVAQLIDDFDEIWPAPIACVPRHLGGGVYAVAPMVWEEITREGAVRAFRVIHPPGLDAEHWFEVRPSPHGTLVRHVVAGEAHSELDDIWREQLEPVHDRILEALLDRLAEKSVTFRGRDGS
jgi:hypothetical protein